MIRYFKGLIYSKLDAGAEPDLVALAPNRAMPIYDRAFVDRYSTLDSTLPPHIFQTA